MATVPITSVLACVNSDVKELLRAHEGSFSSSWIPLLLTMAYEYSCKVTLDSILCILLLVAAIV